MGDHEVARDDGAVTGVGRLIGGLLLVAGLAAGCSGPPVRQRYDNQDRLLQQMGRQIQDVQDASRRQELEKTLEAMRAEIEEARKRHLQDVAELERLQEENRRAVVSSSFAVQSIQVPYFSPVVKTEGLDLWVMPVDGRGDSVKAAGSIQAGLYRRGMLGLGTSGKSLCEWSFSATELEQRWQGTLYKGYHVTLPWPQTGRPEADEAILRVTFTGTDGKSHIAEKAVRLRE